MLRAHALREQAGARNRARLCVDHGRQRLRAVAPGRERDRLASRIDEVHVRERATGRVGRLVDHAAHERGFVEVLGLLEQVDEEFELALSRALRNGFAAALRRIADQHHAVARAGLHHADAHFDVEQRAVAAAMLGFIASAALHAAELQAHRGFAGALVLDLRRIHAEQFFAAVAGHAAIRCVHVEQAAVGVENPATVRRSLDQVARSDGFLAQVRRFVAQLALGRGTLGEIVGRDQVGAAAVEFDFMQGERDLEAAAVLALVRNRGAILGVGCFERRALQREEFRAAVTVERERGIVHRDEAAGGAIGDPHRQRVRFEHATEARFARCQTAIGRFELFDLTEQTRLRLLRALGGFGLLALRVVELGKMLRLLRFRRALRLLELGKPALCFLELGLTLRPLRFGGSALRLLRNDLSLDHCLVELRQRLRVAAAAVLREQLFERREQRLRRHGARDESLGAELERKALVLRIVVAARVEHERDRLQALVLLPFAAQRKAVHARQHDVGNDRMRRLAPRGIEGGEAVARADDAMTLARKQLIQRAQLRFALERNQDHTHAAGLPPRSRAATRSAALLRVFYGRFRPSKQYADEGLISHASGQF